LIEVLGKLIFSSAVFFCNSVFHLFYILKIELVKPSLT